MSNEPKSRLPSLSAVTAGFMFACILVGAAIVFKVIDDRMLSFQEASLRTAVETRVRGVQIAFAASLYREWTNLETLGRSLAVSQPEEIQDDLSTLVGSGRVVSWAGYAGNDGKVRVASNGLLVGADVSSRPWFQRGFRATSPGMRTKRFFLRLNFLLPKVGSRYGSSTWQPL